MTIPTNEQQHEMLTLAVHYRGENKLGLVLSIDEAVEFRRMVRDVRSVKGRVADLATFLSRHDKLINSGLLIPPSKQRKKKKKRKSKKKVLPLAEDSQKSSKKKASKKKAKKKSSKKSSKKKASKKKAKKQTSKKTKKKASKKTSKNKASKKSRRKSGKKASKKKAKKGENKSRKWVHTNPTKLKAFMKKFDTGGEAAEALGIAYESLQVYVGKGKKPRQVPFANKQKAMAEAMKSHQD